MQLLIILCKMKNKMDTKLTDKSLMPFGKYKDYAMENVPASYLVWLYENDKCSNQVRNYIIDNLDFLRMEINEK